MKAEPVLRAVWVYYAWTAIALVFAGLPWVVVSMGAVDLFGMQPGLSADSQAVIRGFIMLVAFPVAMPGLWLATSVAVDIWRRPQ